MSEQIEELIAEAVVAEFEKLPAVHEVVLNAHGIGEIVVRALREAGLLVDGGETELGSDNCECGEIHPYGDVYSDSGFKMTHLRSVWHGPWVPVVDTESGE